MPPKARGGASGGRGRGNPQSNATADPASRVNLTAGSAGRGGGMDSRGRPCPFFMRGNCKFGRRCQYSHTLTQPPAPKFPGLSNDDFSKVNLTQTPGQTFNSLKPYVNKSFRFQTPDQVYQFLSILCGANSQNSSWTAKDGQLHLHQIVEGGGIERIVDAIRFPKQYNRPYSFQRGYIPIFTYLASDWVVKSTMNSDINALYGLVHHNFQIIRDTVEKNLGKLIAARSFRDGTLAISGKQVFKVLFVTLFEYLTRFKEAPATNPGVRDFTEQIVAWFDEWLVGLSSDRPFQDECTTYEADKRDFIIENLQRDKERVLCIIQNGQTVIKDDEMSMPYELPNGTDLGPVAILEQDVDYDGSGDFFATAPRHDNDFPEIEKIRVAPTRNELLCENNPYLPPNFFEAPHFHDPKSIDRLLDIQFRLLREELISPFRLAVHHIVEDLKTSETDSTILSKLLTDGGGRYVSPASSRESVIFSVFTGITFKPLALSNRGISAGIEFDTPPGKARSNQPGVRAEYWEQVSKKQLMQDGLVALIWRDHTGKLDIYVGTVASPVRDLVDGSRTAEGQERLSIHVSFFDTEANLRIVQALQRRHNSSDTRVLIEAPVFYEGIRPFLEALKREPESLPFGKYLRLQSKEELTRTVISPPMYSCTPGFTFELKDLYPPGASVRTLKLNTRDPNSVANTRAQLIRASRLDPSQAEAVVDSLTREVALIQGPPGTGKSYTGLELIRVLVKNKITPILLVAFTNHALDHMLTGILDAEISTKLVRLGSSFAMDERLTEYSLETIERTQGKSLLGRSAGNVYRQMKEMETQMQQLMTSISSHKVPTSHVEQRIAHAYPHHYGVLFNHIPAWIDELILKPADVNDGWGMAGASPKQIEDHLIIDFWLNCRDLQFLETPGNKDAENQAPIEVPNLTDFNVLSESGTGNASITRESFLQDYMRKHGLRYVPTVPDTARPLNSLLEDPKVWRMSRRERTLLYRTWTIEASDFTHGGQIEKFEKFRKAHMDISGKHKEIMNQVKAEILSCSDIVGCTTTGAAKLVSMLSGMGPKIMIVEEAGQVLESHILASLVGSVEHLILIGDPLQLRPNINSYKLATDNPHTGKIYRFDQSLMERLSSSGFPMSQIDVQRRMRPEISSLIRNTLYPNLKDNDRVLSYPNVRGMYKNMFFVSHTWKEAGGGTDNVSKHNSYEVDMIYDLVVHLLKQGCYNKPGNIVILAAYLGQIPKLQRKLQDIVTIVIDERDAELLARQTIDQEETATVQQVQLSQQVIIRTLDNFQGEEGEVIILSLIRNSGTPFNSELSSLEHVKGRSVIGFLKSLNRTNVGLSRAKHGLYIFGNAPELARGSEMWSNVLKEFHSSECLGPKLPIACHRHPNYIRWIDRPGVIPRVSPKGGCLQQCEGALPCGHECISMCHADDPNHISTKCQQPCLRLCPRSHPCDRKCWECSNTIGICRFPITDLKMPCGHIFPRILCHRVTAPAKMNCPTHIVKRLPSCGHDAKMPCHQKPSTFTCRQKVSKELPRCKHRAVLPCPMDPASHWCQKNIEKELPRCKHRALLPCPTNPANYLCQEKVEKALPHCQHRVALPCSMDPASYLCQEMVSKELPHCKHRAVLPCLLDPESYLCQEKVVKKLPNCTHTTMMLCRQNPASIKCREQVSKELPHCQHRAVLPCSMDPATHSCQEKVEKKLPNCAHPTIMACHKSPASYKCQKQVSKELPGCQHHTVLPCHADPSTYSCQEKVEKELPSCKHRMRMFCHQDPSGVLCSEPVEKKLSCDHLITVPCHQDISKHKCKITVEKRLPGCSHSAEMPCHQSPTKITCRERVIKSLPLCGHPAQMLCFEDSKAYACRQPVEQGFSNCSHRKPTVCHQLRDPSEIVCQTRLEKELPACGHRITMFCTDDPTKYQCQEPVQRKLLCGHRATLPCHKPISDHTCQQRVQKQLSFCEHWTPMPCHQDPKTYNCYKECGDALLCCSGACSAQCGACHKLNPWETKSSVRNKHVKHGCQRRITCGHKCNAPCTDAHDCSGICMNKCQQACSHSRCNKKCSTPCSPCEKPCAWKCPHAECTSPCGMACTRLPCDEKCPKTLNCGHPCPSICGEPCEFQTCKPCSEEGTLAFIVDPVGQTHLRDLADNATLDSMTITLPCRHIFTVKALDTITHIRDFYERGNRGEWTKAIMPDASAVRNRPTCPHCRGGIDSLRYGRVLKNSNHSILQHNIAHVLSGQLLEAEQLFLKAHDKLSQSVTEAVRSHRTGHHVLQEKVDIALAADRNSPTNRDIVENLTRFHGFPSRCTMAWGKVVREIMKPYDIACRVTRTTDPSAKAYDESLAQLHLAELNKSGRSTTLPTDPEQHRLQQLAIKVAHVRIGHPRPHASDRFTVEAFWVTVEILLLLALAISKACEEIVQQNAEANLTHWEKLAEFFLLRASADAETAHRLADQSRSRNKAILCQLLILQIQYEHTAHRCRAAVRNRSLSNRETRNDFVGTCARAIEVIRELQTSVPRDYQARVQKDLLAGVNATKADWIQVNFVEPSQKLLDAWNNLAQTIHVDNPEQLQQQASDRQLVMWEPVVQGYARLKRASHTGHFYQCPRGHPYTQEECTIILGTTWCPECGMAVGNVD